MLDRLRVALALGSHAQDLGVDMLAEASRRPTKSTTKLLHRPLWEVGWASYGSRTGLPRICARWRQLARGEVNGIWVDQRRPGWSAHATVVGRKQCKMARREGTRIGKRRVVAHHRRHAVARRKSVEINGWVNAPATGHCTVGNVGDGREWQHWAKRGERKEKEAAPASSTAFVYARRQSWHANEEGRGGWLVRERAEDTFL